VDCVHISKDTGHGRVVVKPVMTFVVLRYVL
jgi:hypothetical protein